MTHAVGLFLIPGHPPTLRFEAMSRLELVEAAVAMDGQLKVIHQENERLKAVLDNLEGNEGKQLAASEQEIAELKAAVRQLTEKNKAQEEELRSATTYACNHVAACTCFVRARVCPSGLRCRLRCNIRGVLSRQQAYPASLRCATGW